MVTNSNYYYYTPLNKDVLEDALKSLFKTQDTKRDFKILTSEIGAISFEITMPYYNKVKSRAINNLLNLYFKYNKVFIQSKERKEIYRKEGNINGILKLNSKIPKYNKLRKINLESAKKLFYG